ncbi:glycosyltransferase family 2 protein [Thermodesulfovibrio thiophilus]|uniref:glycosyltransferase family 2 protein n=1 Tax=Thermodesulfovibrio thiophilus TaxID=340095 RepID=UPI000417D0AF|nr:glycosyltransferase family 2 protein [Thermodesulfovibrio thiophilus]
MCLTLCGKNCCNSKINIPQFNIQNSTISGNPDDKFETMLFLPEGEGRQGEGGIRTKGYFKHSYKLVDGKWFITDSDNNPVMPVPEDIQSKIKQYLSSNAQYQTPITYLPLITVITVVYNGAKYLEETILSVINQTYPNVEYIIIDGGSTDGTLDIIKKYEDYIDYWVSEKDKGIYDAMNKGIMCANGKWLLFVNIGDILLKIPDYKQLDENMDLIVGKVKTISDKVEIVHCPEWSWKIKIKNTLHHQGILYNRKKMSLFNLKYQVFSDFDKNQIMYKFHKNYVKLTDELISSHQLNGISNSKNFFSENYKIILSNFGFIYLIISFIYYKLAGIKYRYKKIKNEIYNFISNLQ